LLNAYVIKYYYLTMMVSEKIMHHETQDDARTIQKS
jgi:hypothetical protein